MKTKTKILGALITAIIFIAILIILTSCTQHKALTPDEFKAKCTELNWQCNDITQSYVAVEANKALGAQAALVGSKNSSLRIEYYNCETHEQAKQNYYDANYKQLEDAEANFIFPVDTGNYTQCKASTKNANNKETITYLICADTNFVCARVPQENSRIIEEALKEMGYL